MVTHANDVRPGDSSFEFTDALLSNGPHAGITHDLFAPLIGDWTLIVTWFNENGEELRKSDGEWHFARVLDGRAIQDVWVVPGRKSRTETNAYEWGTSLRFAQEDGSWRSTWVGPQHGVVHSFIARGINNIITLTTLPGVDPAMRWEFYNICEDKFEWRNILVGSPDRMTQHFLALRA